MRSLILVKTANNLHIIGKKSFWKNLFRSKTIILDDPYFIDFVRNQDGQMERVYLNTMKLFYCENKCILNNRYILFETKPDTELIEMYKSFLESVKQSKNKVEELL